MKRRYFIQAVASALAMSISNAKNVNAYDCENNTSEENTGKILSELDNTVKTIAEDERLNAYAETFKGRGQSQFLLQEVLIALSVRSAFDRMTSVMRKSPLAVSALMQYTPILDRAVLGMTSFIESFDMNERLELCELLKKNEQKLTYLQERFRIEVDKIDHRHGSSVKRMDRLIRYTAWRMKRQGVSPVIESSIAAVDRVGIRFGIDSTLRREFCKEWSHRSGLFENQNTLVAGDATGSSMNRTAKIGLIMLGFGLLVSIVSTILAEREDGKFIFGLTGGVVVMIVGLIVLLVGRKG